MPSSDASFGKPDAGNLHVRFEEAGGGAGSFSLNGPSPPPLLDRITAFKSFQAAKISHNAIDNSRSLCHCTIYLVQTAARSLPPSIRGEPTHVHARRPVERDCDLRPDRATGEIR